MKKIAVYGYGNYGKRMSESFSLYWGGEYIVTAIFDISLKGKRDKVWDICISDPKDIKAEYNNGVFEAVIICIYDRGMYQSISNAIKEQGIPVFLPGKKEDFAEPEDFLQEINPDISVRHIHYGFHVYRNIYGAVADFNRKNMMFLFNEEGKINIEYYKKYMDYYEPLLLSYPFRLKNPIPEKVFMKGSYCIIAKAHSGNYYHFTFEAADGIYLLETAGYNGKYIYDGTGFAKELLLMMGISPERLMRIEDFEIHKVYVFERLFEINHPGFGSEIYLEDVLPKMSEKIKNKLKKENGYPEKIYIKRTGIRRLLNGEEIAEKNGFHVIIPQEHSVREQMELFYNADIVLCPHGANSTNFLYMHKGAVFIEIFSDLWHMTINEPTCKECGIHYLQLVGTACPGEQKDRERDYYVEEDELQKMIWQAEKIIKKEVW